MAVGRGFQRQTVGSRGRVTVGQIGVLLVALIEVEKKKAEQEKYD